MLGLRMAMFSAVYLKTSPMKSAHTLAAIIARPQIKFSYERQLREKIASCSQPGDYNVSAHA